MGTRALTIFHDPSDEQEIVVLYRQMDGYPSGHGLDLLQALSSSGDKVTNGLNGTAFNGAPDLAVRVIALLKGDATQPGSFYLYPAKTRDCGEDYRYHVSAQEGQPIRVKVEDGSGEELFDGGLKAFRAFCKKDES
jgi:hypothetical protein